MRNGKGRRVKGELPVASRRAVSVLLVLVVVTLHTRMDTDAHHDSPGASSFSSDFEITTKGQTFFLPAGVQALEFSTSRFGITAKELICELAVSYMTHTP